MAVKTENGVEFLLEAAQKQGISCSTVKDGHVFIITKLQLQAFLAQCEEKGSDMLTVFVKRPDFQN
jgi:hypothetical protein